VAGIENIINKIIQDAEEKARRIAENAKQRAAEISINAKKDIEKKESAMRKKALQTANQKAERLIAAAQLEGKKTMLAAKQALIDSAFTSAVNRLASLEENEYKKLISSMSENIKGEVLLLPRDKEKGTGGGFIVKDGKVEYNFSFEVLAKRAKESLESKIVSVLFG